MMDEHALRRSWDQADHLTKALCGALLIKKCVTADRYSTQDTGNDHPCCPHNCHACCTSSTILDLTAVEALTVYLLNRGIVQVMDEAAIHQASSGYCPFLVRKKCIIHTYKPTACQMYMPFEHQGKPMCFYLAASQQVHLPACSAAFPMNSNAYAIHGCMMLLQSDISDPCAPTCFKHIFEGVVWWKKQYGLLPERTRNLLEAILAGEETGMFLVQHFDYRASLSTGLDTYLDVLSGQRTYQQGQLH